jgi:DNA-binding response OmpR family regulator
LLICAERSRTIVLIDGADDYVTKPFGMGELIARVCVVLRLSLRAAAQHQLLSLRAATINAEARTAAHHGKPVHLTPIEYRIIACLVRNPGMVVTHQPLLTEVWGGYTRIGHALFASPPPATPGGGAGGRFRTAPPPRHKNRHRLPSRH